MRAYAPGDGRIIASVIQVVVPEITQQCFVALMSTMAPIVQLTGFGVCSSGKIAFRSDSLLASVKVGLVHHPVRPYVLRPLQCRKCMQRGHVNGSSLYALKCNRGGSGHASGVCGVQALKCTSCLCSNQTSSRDCHILQKKSKTARVWQETTCPIKML